MCALTILIGRQNYYPILLNPTFEMFFSKIHWIFKIMIAKYYRRLQHYLTLEWLTVSEWMKKIMTLTVWQVDQLSEFLFVLFWRYFYPDFGDYISKIKFTWHLSALSRLSMNLWPWVTYKRSVWKWTMRSNSAGSPFGGRPVPSLLSR